MAAELAARKRAQRVALGPFRRAVFKRRALAATCKVVLPTPWPRASCPPAQRRGARSRRGRP
eukprot:9587870-Lingulodinium_polyedra.AAC.1